MAGTLEERTKIPLFDGSNFNNWKFRMEILLEELELLELIDEPYTQKVKFLETDTTDVKASKEADLEKLKKRDRKCRLQIVQRIADTHLEYVKDTGSAFEMWFSTGATLEESDVVCHLLLTMPSYRSYVRRIRCSLETLSAENLTLSFAKNRLLEEESKKRSFKPKPKVKNENQQNIAFVTSTKRNTVRGNAEKFKFKCYNCGIVGHKRSECKKPQKRNDFKNSNAEAKAAVAKPSEEECYCFPAMNGKGLHSKSIETSQRVYIQNLLKRFGMENCDPIRTPFEKGQAQVKHDEDAVIEEKPYRELVGCLSYLTLNTRPDICAAVNYYSRFQSLPTESHWKGLKRILRYLCGTMNLGLFYGKTEKNILVGYADSDWASDTSRKSTTGYLFKVFGSTVCWQTKKQSSIALSSTEAEYVALAMAATEFVWLKNLLKEFNIETGVVTIYEDNQSCILKRI
ncbi:Zinc knuckle [Popillia japonica]|uniref:Zinc knuckle n=1 Tax=Popillia japonica TaxID=7064 RepID=A0AAW1LUS9_POPJA